MAKKQEIDVVSQSMPGVPRWLIERQIDSGAIDLDNYED